MDETFNIEHKALSKRWQKTKYKTRNLTIKVQVEYNITVFAVVSKRANNAWSTNYI